MFIAFFLQLGYLILKPYRFI